MQSNTENMVFKYIFCFFSTKLHVKQITFMRGVQKVLQFTMTHEQHSQNLNFYVIIQHNHL